MSLSNQTIRMSVKVMDKLNRMSFSTTLTNNICIILQNHRWDHCIMALDIAVVLIKEPISYIERIDNIYICSASSIVKILTISLITSISDEFTMPIHENWLGQMNGNGKLYKDARRKLLMHRTYYGQENLNHELKIEYKKRVDRRAYEKWYDAIKKMAPPKKFITVIWNTVLNYL